MKNIDELRDKKPRLWRVACEIARCKTPDRVLSALLALAGPAFEEDHHEQ